MVTQKGDLSPALCAVLPAHNYFLELGICSPAKEGIVYQSRGLCQHCVFGSLESKMAA